MLLDGDLEGFLEGSGKGHLDLPRAQVYGMVGGFYACWVANPDDDPEASEPGPLDPELARADTATMIEQLYALEEMSDGELQVVRTVEDLRDNLEAGIHSAILHFEGAEAISEDLSELEDYYALGLRSLGPVWSRSNVFGHGVPFLFPSTPDLGPGLTAAGFELVSACNSLGIMLDLSHLNEAGFWDVARLSRHPLVATHSNPFALCPSPRNLTDDQLRAIADSGGLVGVNFYVGNLREDGEEEDTSIDTVLDHFDYLVETIGVDHIAIGTDFDGATVPLDLDGVEFLPDLLDGLSERGWSDDEIEAIGYGNWLRVLGTTWED